MNAVKSKLLAALGSALLLLAFGHSDALAQRQTERSYDPVRFDQMSLEGPRFGVTYVTGNGELWKRLDDEGMSRTLSQFGWHFESRIIPEGGGPQFVIETVPMLAGVEYGKFLPSATLAMGVRFPRGWEFGIGPNVLVTGTNGSEDLRTSLVMAGGYSFQYGGVNLPVNLAFATNPEGNRVALIFGYAVRKSR